MPHFIQDFGCYGANLEFDFENDNLPKIKKQDKVKENVIREYFKL